MFRVRRRQWKVEPRTLNFKYGCSVNQTSASSLTTYVCSVCVFCGYDYVLQSAGSRLDSSLTKMNHPAKPLGDQQAFWDTWPRLQRRLWGQCEPTPPSLPDPDTLPSSPPLCPSSPPPSFFLISLTVLIIAKHLMKIDLFLCLPPFPPFPIFNSNFYSCIYNTHILSHSFSFISCPVSALLSWQ